MTERVTEARSRAAASSRPPRGPVERLARDLAVDVVARIPFYAKLAQAADATRLDPELERLVDEKLAER